ncbi:MAG: nuclear transport factor 2 family protein [Meiothermus sp.]|nr:nuclear transport factor 2 family protein [Meiothermus sp.]
MNTDDAKHVVMQYFHAIDAGDLDTALAQFSQDSVYERPGYPPLEGIDQIRNFYQSVRVIRRGRHTLEGLLVEGDQAVTWGVFEGESRDGVQLQERWSDVYRLKGGKIAYRRTHFFRAAV